MVQLRFLETLWAPFGNGNAAELTHTVVSKWKLGYREARLRWGGIVTISDAEVKAAKHEEQRGVLWLYL